MIYRYRIRFYSAGEVVATYVGGILRNIFMPDPSPALMKLLHYIPSVNHNIEIKPFPGIMKIEKINNLSDTQKDVVGIFSGSIVSY